MNMLQSPSSVPNSSISSEDTSLGLTQPLIGLSQHPTSLWTVKIIHLNAAKSQNVTRDLIKSTFKQQNTVTCINESNRIITSDYVRSPNILTNDQTTIVVSNNLKILAYDNSIANFIAAVISYKKKAIIVCTAYLNPARNYELMEIAISNLNRFIHLPFIFTSDVNCEHHRWSPKSPLRHNAAASLLNDWLTENNLTVLNGSPTPDSFTYLKGEKKSWIDIMISNCNFSDFKLLDFITDHRKLETRVTLSDIFSNLIEKNASNKRLYVRCKPRLDIKINMENNYEIDQTFRRLLNNCFEKRKFKPIKYLKYNPRIRRLRNRIQIMKRQNRTSFSPEINEEIKNLKELEYKTRKSSEKNAIGYMLRNLKDSKKIWGVLNKILHKADTLSSFLNKNVGTEDELRHYRFIRPYYTYTSGQEKNYLSEGELELLEVFAFKKSSGYADDFTLTGWLSFWSKNKSFLINLIKQTFEHGYIPQYVKIYGAHLLPKPNGGLRTIKISNYILKIYDRILAHRVKTVLEKVIIRRTQFAYQDNLNATDFHVTLIENWKINKLLISTDISKAFDMVDVEKAFLELKPHLNSSDIQMLKQFVYGRWLRTRVDNTFKFKPDPIGVPQGSEIGPLLFICALNYAIRKLKTKNIKVFAYADDIVVITEKNKKDETMEILINTLAEINLQINVNKTKFYDVSCEPIKIAGKLFNMKTTIPNIDKIVNSIKPKIINNLATLYKLPRCISRLVINSIAPSMLSQLSPSILCENQSASDLLYKIQLRVNVVLKAISPIPNRISPWAPIALLNIINPLKIWIQDVTTTTLRTSLDLRRWPFLTLFTPLPLFRISPNMNNFYAKRVTRPIFPQAGFKIKSNLIQIICNKGVSFYNIDNPTNTYANYLLAVHIMANLTKDTPTTYVLPDILVKWPNSSFASFTANILNQNPKYVWMNCEKVNNISKPKGSIINIKNNIVTYPMFIKKMQETFSTLSKQMYEKDASTISHFFHFDGNFVRYGKVGSVKLHEVLKLIGDLSVTLSKLVFLKNKERNLYHYLHQCKSTKHLKDNLKNGWKYSGHNRDDDERTDSIMELITIIRNKTDKIIISRTTS